MSCIVPIISDYLKNRLHKKIGNTKLSSNINEHNNELVRTSPTIEIEDNEAVTSDSLIGVTIVNTHYITTFVLSIVGNVAVLITFGVIVPILGIAMFITIIFQTTYTQYIVGIYIIKVWESQKFEYASKVRLLRKLKMKT